MKNLENWKEIKILLGMPIIPAFGRPKQEDHKFEVSLSYTVRPCFKNQNCKKQRKSHPQSNHLLDNC
jgi:hypothetical protein